jgi:hypothetical protein
VARAQAFRRTRPTLTVADSVALALAETNAWVLLTGDGALRALAEAERLECHGLLWLLDRLESQRAATTRELRDALARLSAHPKCRLPRGEITMRLERYEIALRADRS